MRHMRSMLMATLVVAGFGMASDAVGQGYYRSYGSYYYQRPYQNNYHGYWRDQGYGFSNRPTYGGYYSSDYYWGGYNPYRGGYSVPAGRGYRW